MARKSTTEARLEGNEAMLRQLQGIKRLLTLFLMKAGTTQAEIGIALEMDQADVSRMLPAGKIKRFTENGR